MIYIRIIEITAATKRQSNVFLDHLKITHFVKSLYKANSQQKFLE